MILKQVPKNTNNVFLDPRTFFTTLFTCNHCGKKYDKRVSASGHLRRNHRLPFVCPEGDARYLAAAYKRPKRFEFSCIIDLVPNSDFEPY